jgi:large subunit ribosomal protein L21
VFVREGYWPPDAGDRISLDKVLLVGANDFTLIGRPLVQKGLVRVEATVIEKTLSHTKTHFRKKRRKQYMRINFYRIPQTMLRVNRIEIVGEVNHPPDVTGLETRIF